MSLVRMSESGLLSRLPAYGNRMRCAALGGVGIAPRREWTEWTLWTKWTLWTRRQREQASTASVEQGWGGHVQRGPTPACSSTRDGHNGERDRRGAGQACLTPTRAGAAVVRSDARRKSIG